MKQADVGVALLLFLIVLGFALYSWAGPLRREKRKAARYPLFAVRDDMVRLVAEGKIQENDPVFDFLYGGVNYLIPRVKPFTLKRLVEAFDGSPFVRDEVRQQYLAAVNHADPAVREVARNLFLTLAEILLTRSIFVWTSAKLTHRGLKFASACRRGLSGLFRTECAAYELHRNMNQLATAA